MIFCRNGCCGASQAMMDLLEVEKVFCRQEEEE